MAQIEIYGEQGLSNIWSNFTKDIDPRENFMDILDERIAQYNGRIDHKLGRWCFIFENDEDAIRFVLLFG